MLKPYLVKVNEVSQEIADELSQFGYVTLVSEMMGIYLLETNPDFINSVKTLSFVEKVQEELKRSLMKDVCLDVVEETEK